ncbi:long-chain-fatty-acid--CoA ligase ACSBG2-like isoform X2 [Glandiceps talaboti]
MSADVDRAYSPTDSPNGNMSGVAINSIDDESPTSSPMKMGMKQSEEKSVNGTSLVNGVSEDDQVNGTTATPSGVSIDVHVDRDGSGKIASAVADKQDKVYTIEADGAIKLRIGDSGPQSEPPVTVHDLMMTCVKSLPNHIAMSTKKDGQTVEWTWREYYNDCRRAAKSFIKLGLEKFHGVGIVGFNSPEWFLADIGAIFAGGFAVGVYTTNSPEACHYVAENCEANVIVVENTAQLNKILKIWDKLPHLKAVVQYSGEVEQKRENLYDWSQFMALADDVLDVELDDRIKELVPNKCCTLIYTSGTTGNPKGVMLSHDNLIWTARMCVGAAKLKHGEDCLVSYLPLSHVAAQLFDIYIPMVCIGTTYFAQPDALKGSLVNTLKEIRPTAFLAVPRVWEKIYEKMREVGRGVTGFKKKMATWAKSIGYQGNMKLMNGHSLPWGWTLANMLVFKRVRAALGLDRCHLCFNGAAPISRDTLDYFMSINIPIYDIYGMSESSGPHTISLPGAFRIGSAGREFPGVSTKLADPDKDGNGEICYSGRHVFMGYLKMEEKTRDAIDDEGWLHSGDIGKKDDKGFLYITGRIKEILITAGGENVPPVLIEDIIKAETPIIGNCMLIGDRQKFLALLVTLKCEVDPDSQEPEDKLTSEAISIAKALGCDATTVTEAKTDEKIMKAIQDGIDRYNKKATSRAQKVQKYAILDHDFSVPGGEFGPTLKLKRHFVVNKYQGVIDSFYGEETPRD